MDFKKANREVLILEICKKDMEIASLIIKNATLELEISILEREIKEK